MRVLITGALRGLGASLVKRFLAAGDTVFALVMPSGGLGELAAVAGDDHLTLLPADLSKQTDIEEARRLVGEKTDRLDMIINAAGVLLNKEGFITEDSYANLETTFKVNTIAPIYLNNLFMDLLRGSGDAAILNICSEVRSIEDVGDWFPAYCLSKTALTQYCFALKATLQKQNFAARVFAVHPGRMKTAMGGANGEIGAEESAAGIYRIAAGEVWPANEHIYINYKGEPMLR